LTAFATRFLAFEWRAWRQLRKPHLCGRVRCRSAPPADVSGFAESFRFLPAQGAYTLRDRAAQWWFAWPPGFSQLENQKNGFPNLRNLYRYLPFARSTYRDAAAIIAASSQTYSEFAAYRDKLFFVPEPGIARSLCFGDTRSPDPAPNLS
jgi:hypothetical protein